MQSKKFKQLSILIDNPNSWMWSYIAKLQIILQKHAQNTAIYKNTDDLQKGEILFILSCDKILSQKHLAFHKNNIVIHASDLPKGRGWSPWSHEVEQGSNELTLTLFEADKELDSGNWYLKQNLILDGTELIDKIRELLAYKQFEMINEYLKRYPIKSNPQTGEATYYDKRSEKNQEIQLNQTIQDCFNLFRVCDNENYPAHFYKNGKKYILKIYEA